VADQDWTVVEEQDAPKQSGFDAFMAAKGAPRQHGRFSSTDIEKKAEGVEAETPEKRAAYIRRHEILDALRDGDNKPLSRALAEHHISYEQARELRRRARLTPLQDRVHNFTYAEIWRVYQVADANEKKQLKPVLRRKRALMFEKKRGEEVRDVEAQQ